jgi:DNA-binding transcriptional LysR family regulator
VRPSTIVYGEPQRHAEVYSIDASLIYYTTVVCILRRRGHCKSIMQRVSWDEFRLVKAIADTGSLAGAGELLGLNHSTIFRRLNALEEELGSRLFERSRTGYMPTPAGEEMVSLAARMSDDIVEFERRVAGRDVKPSGELRVTTNDSLVAHLATPIFGAFCHHYPEIKLDVMVDNRALNLSRRDADVAIRATSEPPETLVGRRIGTIAWSIYGNRASGQEATRNPLDLVDQPWIGFGDSIGNIGPSRWMMRAVPAGRIVYRLNTVLGLSQAIEAGLGIGFVPCFIGDNSPGLRRLLKAPMTFDTSLWMLTHPDLKNAARVRVFLDFVGRELMKYKALIEGAAPSAD